MAKKVEKKVLVCWNTPVPDFEKYTDKSDQAKDNFVFEAVSSLEKLVETANINKVYKYIIVQCELEWEGKQPSDYYGIEIVRDKLRLAGVTIPILILSADSKVDILEKDSSNDIITTHEHGNYFAQIPFSNKVWNEFIQKTKGVGIKVLVCWNAQVPDFEKYTVKSDQAKNNFVFIAVSSLEELVKTVNINKVYKYIIVQCELEWEGKQPSDYYGIEIVRDKLRLAGVTIPILILSVSSKKDILEKNHTYDIIRTRVLGNYFTQMPLSKEVWNEFIKMKPLSESRKIDLVNNFCNLDGMAARVRHDLDAIRIDEAKKRLCHIAAHVDSFSFPECNTNEEIIDACNRLELCLLGKCKNETEHSTKVLLLDDMENEDITALIREAKKDNVVIVHHTNYNAALENLKEDVSKEDYVNDYKVIMCDFRLWDNPEDQNSDLTSKQGYEFFDEASELGRLYKYVTFSNLPSMALRRFESALSVKFEPMLKSLIKTKDGRRYIIDCLYRWGNAQEIKRIEDISKNEKFGKYYSKFLSSIDYETTENTICTKAKSMIDAFVTRFKTMDIISSRIGHTHSAASMTNSKQFNERLAERRFFLYVNYYINMNIRAYKVGNIKYKFEKLTNMESNNKMPITILDHLAYGGILDHSEDLNKLKESNKTEKLDQKRKENEKRINKLEREEDLKLYDGSYDNHYLSTRLYLSKDMKMTPEEKKFFTVNYPEVASYYKTNYKYNNDL